MRAVREALGTILIDYVAVLVTAKKETLFVFFFGIGFWEGSSDYFSMICACFASCFGCFF